MRYDSGEFSCLAYNLPPCTLRRGRQPQRAFGIKGKTGFSLTVTRAGKVLKREAYAKTITVETRGQVADDAGKLDYVDVKYGETTNFAQDGVRLTKYGSRAVRINMRTGGYDPGESVSFGSSSVDGHLANDAGEVANANDFASFVSQTIHAYHDREKDWQTPGACAKLTFDPIRDSVMVSDGDKGSFSAQVTANSDGQRAAKARWMLSAQQNGTFSPTTTEGAQPSFDYTVAAQSGTTLSTMVRATSTAGVAEDLWRQNLDQINTITRHVHRPREGQRGDLRLVRDRDVQTPDKRCDTGQRGLAARFRAGHSNCLGERCLGAARSAAADRSISHLKGSSR